MQILVAPKKLFQVCFFWFSSILLCQKWTFSVGFYHKTCFLSMFDEKSKRSEYVFKFFKHLTSLFILKVFLPEYTIKLKIQLSFWSAKTTVSSAKKDRIPYLLVWDEMINCRGNKSKFQMIETKLRRVNITKVTFNYHIALFWFSCCKLHQNLAYQLLEKYTIRTKISLIWLKKR